jgi:hypothetical protein
VSCCVKGFFDVQEYSSRRHTVIEIQSSLHCFLYRLGTDHPQKTHQLLSNGYYVMLSGVSTHAFPSNGRPIVTHSLLDIPVCYLAIDALLFLDAR